MRDEDLKKLADHYDSTDLSAEIQQAERDDSVEAEPMVTTSLRLPKSVLDQVRAKAAEEGIKPTALIRRWVEREVTTSTQVNHKDFVPALNTALACADPENAHTQWLLVLSALYTANFRQAVHDELAPVRQFIADHERPTG